MKNLLLCMLAWLISASMAMAAVNVNTATKEQLDSLKGIGPTKAQAIIDYRTKNGPFKSIDDLEKVPGIGPATLKEIRKDVTLTGSTTTPAASAAPKKDASASTKADTKADTRKDAGKLEDKKATAKAADPKGPVKAEEKKAAAKAEDKKATPKAEDKKNVAKEDSKKSAENAAKKDAKAAQDEKK